MAWYLVPYKRRIPAAHPTRYCAMDDFTSVIQADGGGWSETEVLGDLAVVKVQALPATLSLINAEPGFFRLLVDNLTDPLGSLTPAQGLALRAKITALGYSDAEVTAALGNNLRQRTLGEVLRFTATRRLKPRYDPATDTIFVDGPIQVCKTVDAVNGEV